MMKTKIGTMLLSGLVFSLQGVSYHVSSFTKIKNGIYPSGVYILVLLLLSVAIFGAGYGLKMIADRLARGFAEYMAWQGWKATVAQQVGNGLYVALIVTALVAFGKGWWPFRGHTENSLLEERRQLQAEISEFFGELSEEHTVADVKQKLLLKFAMHARCRIVYAATYLRSLLRRIEKVNKKLRLLGYAELPHVDLLKQVLLELSSSPEYETYYEKSQWGPWLWDKFEKYLMFGAAAQALLFLRRIYKKGSDSDQEE